MRMPRLNTDRLIIRPFTADDLDAKQCLDSALGHAVPVERQRAWLGWASSNHEELARLYQPPYGDRAIILRQSGELIGSCGLVPALGPFDRLPSFRHTLHDPDEERWRPEFGLYYAFHPSHRRQGYATEAARALVAYGFNTLNLQRIIATTTYGNEASMAVMRHLGMSVERNPYPEPPWFQVVGVLWNPRSIASRA